MPECHVKTCGPRTAATSAIPGLPGYRAGCQVDGQHTTLTTYDRQVACDDQSGRLTLNRQLDPVGRTHLLAFRLLRPRPFTRPSQRGFGQFQGPPRFGREAGRDGRAFAIHGRPLDDHLLPIQCHEARLASGKLSKPKRKRGRTRSPASFPAYASAYNGGKPASTPGTIPVVAGEDLPNDQWGEKKMGVTKRTPCLRYALFNAGTKRISTRLFSAPAIRRSIANECPS